VKILSEKKSDVTLMLYELARIVKLEYNLFALSYREFVEVLFVYLIEVL
jgi:hypothetical protein